MREETVAVVASTKTAFKMCISSHCILHRQALTIKSVPDSLKSVLDNAVQIVNFIKARHLNSRHFKLFCNGTGNEYETLIFHTIFRWLSRGKLLIRVLQLIE